jgi:hypothetical protein
VTDVELSLKDAVEEWNALGLDRSKFEVDLKEGSGALHADWCSHGLTGARVALTSGMRVHRGCLGDAVRVLAPSGSPSSALTNVIAAQRAERALAEVRAVGAHQWDLSSRAPRGSEDWCQDVLRSARRAAEALDLLRPAREALEERPDERAGFEDPTLAGFVTSVEDELENHQGAVQACLRDPRVPEALVLRAVQRMRMRAGEGLGSLLEAVVRDDDELLKRPVLVVLDDPAALMPEEVMALTAFGGWADAAVLPVCVARAWLREHSVKAVVVLRADDDDEVVETALALWRDDPRSLKDHLVTARALAD